MSAPAGSTLFLSICKRINNESMPTCQKLKLIKYAWKSSHVLLKNKEQNLIIILCNLLKNNKGLKNQEISQIWKCFLNILLARRTSNLLEYNTRFIFQPLLSKVFIETLTDYNGENNDMYETVIKCCCEILEDKDMSHLISSKFEYMVELLVVTLRIINLQLSNSQLPFDGIECILKAFVVRQKAVLNQTLIQQVIINKILKPALELRYLLINCTDSRYDCTIVQGILDEMLQKAFFHRNHHVSLLRSLEKKQTSLKVNCLTYLYDLIHSTQETTSTECNKHVRDNTYKYLPDYYRDFLQIESLQPQHCQHMFQILCGVLGFGGKKMKIAETDQLGELGSLNSLLTIFLKLDVHRPLFGIDGGDQFYQQLFNNLMQFKRCTEWFQCVLSLLRISHTIIDSRLEDVVFSCCDLTCVNSLPSQTKLMSEIVETYSKLHQNEMLLKQIFKVIEKVEKPQLISFDIKLCSIIEEFCKLNMSSTMIILHTFMNQMRVVCGELTNSFSELKSRQLQSLVTMLQLYSSSRSNTGYSINSTAEMSIIVKELQVILFNLLELYINKKSELLLSSSLLIYSTITDITLVLQHYQKQDSNCPLYNKIKDHIQNDVSSSIKYLWIRINITKIRKSLNTCDRLKTITLEVIDKIKVNDITNITWDGMVENMCDVKCTLACWKLLCNECPVVLMTLSELTIKQLAIIMFTAIKQNCCFPKSSLKQVSFYSESIKLLRKPQIEENQLFHKAFMDTIAEHLLKTSTTDIRNRNQLKKYMQLNDACVLPDETTSTIAEVFRILPISNFTDNEKSQAISVCIFVISILFVENRESLLNDYIDILSAILETCNRSTLLHVTTVTEYLDWLLKLSSRFHKQLMFHRISNLIENSCFALILNCKESCSSSSLEDTDQIVWSNGEDESLICSKLTLHANLLNHIQDISNKQNKDRVIKYITRVKTDISTESCMKYISYDQTNITSELIINSTISIMSFARYKSPEILDETFIKYISYILEVLLTGLQNSKGAVQSTLNLIIELCNSEELVSKLLTSKTSHQLWMLLYSKIQDLFSDCEADKTKEISGSSDLYNEISVSRVCATVILHSNNTFNNILHMLIYDINMAKFPDNKLCSSLSLLTDILDLSLSKNQEIIITKALPVILTKLCAVLSTTGSQSNSIMISRILMAIIKIFTSRITMMHFEEAVVCLNCCYLLRKDCVSYLLVQLFNLMTDMIHTFLRHYKHYVKYVVPTFIGFTKLLMTLLRKYGSETNEELDRDKLEVCADKFLRICFTLNKEKLVFRKVALYTIAEYCRFTKTLLKPEVKKVMVKGINLLIDMCDEHQIKLLQTMSSLEMRNTFLHLYKEYKLHYKYVGKA